VDAAVQAGANQVYGPTLSIAEQSEIYDEALNEALADARDKAATIASAAGVSLGEVVNIVEGGGGFVPPIPYGGDAEAAVPIEPGLQDVQATLTVTFSIA
jgi:uncharacterized protein YggE